MSAEASLRYYHRNKDRINRERTKRRLNDPEFLRKERESQRRWRTHNPEKARLKSTTFSRQRRAWLNSLKEGKPCSDCGGYFPTCCLDWHHLGRKTMQIGASSCRAKEKLLNEIARCVLLCANCHRIRTHIPTSKLDRSLRSHDGTRPAH